MNSRYGTLESHPSLETSTPHRHSDRHSYKLIFLGALLGIGIGSVMTIHSNQSHQFMQIQQQLLNHENQLNQQKALKLKHQLPSKFVVEHVTPLKTQDHRGTCWDFATVGVLEQTYRAQGIANGWLPPDKYVALSEQAYGKEVLELCSGPFDSPQQQACRVPGDSIWQNSTEGGEAPELYYLVNGLKEAVFPHSICPYIPFEGQDTLCPNLTAQAKEKNPLSFDVLHIETYYDILTVKQNLVQKKQAMTFTTAMPFITHYYPCIGPLKKLDSRCDPDLLSCVLCPPELAMSECCIPIVGGENYNMEGEFIAHRGMTLEGGHVMTLAGYNDLYRTKDGFTGGYILKNSWFDGTHPPLGPQIPRASHSLRYWLRTISDWEERVICPNSHSPYNWYQCGNADEVTEGHRTTTGSTRIPLPNHGASFNRSHAFQEGIDSCLSEETQIYANTNIQPLHLKCTDATYCQVNPNVTYFVRNMTEWGDRMTMMCMFEFDERGKDQDHHRDFCLPPLLVRSVAKIFSPVEAEVRANDPDQCGFYFMPYEVVQRYVNLFEGFFVNAFDIVWHPQSYAANQEEYPNLDYSYVKESTQTQRQREFVGPFPFARVVT